MKVFCFLLVISTAFANDYNFTANSVKSDLFKPIRDNNAEVVVINQCDKDVTAPYGVLEASFKQNTAEQNPKCTWKLHAPDNHVINVRRVSFVMADELKSGQDDASRTLSTISLYDGPESEEGKLLTRYFVYLKEKTGYFIQSLSSGRDMTVEIKYHDSKNYYKQRMAIEYEFVDVGKMKSLLKTLHDMEKESSTH